MSNKEIFSRTFGFSVRRFFYTLLAFIVFAALCTVGFLVGIKFMQEGFIGLAIGAIVGLIALVIFLRYIAYSYKAGQIAMMTKAIVEDELPDDVIGEGKRIVKSRFKTVAVFFALTGVIKGIFNQLGNAITNLGDKLGGDTGRSVGSAISMVISVIVSYLCDCCLGWVFYRSSISSAKATCEGAVLFFKHGKTFAKNMGRVFGMGFVSLLIIGGVFGGLFYVIGLPFTEVFEGLAQLLQEAAVETETNIPQFLMTTQGLTISCAALGGIIVWSIIHGSFIRPFVLTGVLRNYIQAGMADIPTEASFSMLDSKSKKFRKLHESLA